MKKLYTFLALAIIAFIYACGGKPAKSQQAMIVGKWTLQNQNIAIYINDVKQSEIATSTSNKTVASIQFNADGSFSSTQAFNSGGFGNTNLQSQIGTASTSGKYSFTGSAFSMTPNLIASLWDGTTPPPLTTVPTYKLVSESASIGQLNSTLLTLHTETVVTQTTDSNISTYKTVADYNYTR